MVKAEHRSLVVSVLAFLAAAWAMKYARSQARSAEGQLEVARRVHREQNEPYVIVDIQLHEAGSLLLGLIIQNVGPTLARNVRIAVTPDLTSTQGDDVGEALAQVIARPIAMMPPGRRLVYFFDSAVRRFESDLPMLFEFTVHGDGPMGPVEELKYTVDLEVLSETLVGQRATKPLEDRLDKVSKGLRDLTGYYQEANQQAIAATRSRRMEEVRQRREAHQQNHGAGSADGSCEPGGDA
ncbi:hypothetical protein [Streptomyces sp. N50]|uniref:hypothetical protein n=1 Tax=Streptomyces sp. N50 TaxID=3081765 RepID=UPI0029623C1C|nr:hypothetical protein [Streptomyces sp. N50]WOX11356.1 hypothetical protein R2B38_22135 [Streptomyces sp. N50]